MILSFFFCIKHESLQLTVFLGLINLGPVIWLMAIDYIGPSLLAAFLKTGCLYTYDHGGMKM